MAKATPSLSPHPDLEHALRRRRKTNLFKSANHAINYCARSIAKKAVIEQLRDQGVRVTLVKPVEIAERAKVYLEQHPELYQQALERARRLGFVEPRKRMSRNQLLPLFKC